MENSSIKEIEAYYNNYYAKIAVLFSVLLVLISGWDFAFMRYWKDFVVFIHEVFHVFTASLTGGEIKRLVLHGNESGEVQAIGGWKYGIPLVYASGYIGCVALGARLLHSAFDEKKALIVLRFFSLFVLLNTIVFTEIFSYTWKIGFFWSILVLFLSFGNKRMIHFSLVCFGTAICLYGIIDLKDFFHKIEDTDAGLLARWILIEWDGNQSPEKKGVKEVGTILAFIIITLSLSIFAYYFYKIFFYPRREDELALKKMLKEYKDGNVPEDVIDWFLKRELSLDGRPISKETIKDIKERGFTK